MSVAWRHHLAAEEARCRQTRLARPRCVRPTRTVTGSSNCCAPPSPTAVWTRLNSMSGWTRRWPAAPTGPAAELVKIREKHGMVRRDGRWTLPRR